MPDVAHAVAAYFAADRPAGPRTTQDPAPDPAPEAVPPPLIALPLRERLALLDDGALTLPEWNALADGWAREADHRYRACAELRPAGPHAPALRLGVKDTVDVAGFATRLGLRRHRHHPGRSAAVLTEGHRLATVAKVVTTELNIGIGSGCGNPWFPTIDPAGSSTGCGVAVAAGICDLALGTDVLGSVRWPAGRCGVVGLRMTHDPAALRGMLPLSPAMDAPGWVARTADDLALLAEVSGLPIPRAEHHRGLRIGVVAEVAEGGAEPGILDALKTAGELLAAHGHRVATTRLGGLWDLRGAAWELCARQAWQGSHGWDPRIADELSPSTRRAVDSGAAIGDLRHREIEEQLARTRAAVPRLFADAGVDVWLLPLDPDVPRPVGAQRAASSLVTPGHPDYDREIGYTPVASFAGLPALTFPVGRTADGSAPLAVQLVGRPGAEGVLIGLAREAARTAGDPARP
ncbi:amidase [Kitasatospora sp. NPDC048540]|uniref:amidase n=1 Tax=Kitasatospora sp. NPDC048540 TaxID=3155634 RepID=UPI0033E92993